MDRKRTHPPHVRQSFFLICCSISERIDFHISEAVAKWPGLDRIGIRKFKPWSPVSSGQKRHRRDGKTDA
jgi:hypothetical protein